MTANKSFIGLADCYLKPYNVAGAARALGSVSACQLQHQVTELRQRNYGRAGGTLNRTDRLDRVLVALTLQSVSAANLALATRGGITNVSASTVSAEEHTAHLGALIRTAHMNISSVVVEDDAELITYEAGVDYKVTGAGIVPLEGGAISENDPIKISYSFSARVVIEALTQPQTEWTFYFDGLNEAEGGENTAVDLHRIKFGTVQNIDMIGDDYATLQLTAELLVDPTKVGVGESQFYNWAHPSA
ncbi:MAG: hypothetical protein ACPGJF_03360 [Sinimarinibacterium flocculans]|uniref:phage tail tube protein n=1 Tax=Sinimarinibacterium flocculans TaxID=985250 RepID=UPI003C3CE864